MIAWQQQASELLIYLQNHLPLPGFVFAGALLEEIVSPIPSSVVQIGVGSLAQSQNYPWYWMILLGIIGAIGNTVGSLWHYGLYRLIGAWIVKNIGKWVGLTAEKVTDARAFLEKGARDDVVIFLLRALPFVPIINPSVICGILGIKFTTYVISTFLGYTVRNTYMLTVGFVGVDAIKSGDPKAIGMIVLIAIFVLLIVMISHRHSQRAKAQDQRVDEV